MDIKLLRLTSGEEIIGAASHEMNGTWNVEKPAVIQFVDQGGGQVGAVPVNFVPFHEGGDRASINIDDSHVMFSYPPNSNVKQMYQTWASKIIMPQGPNLSL